MTLPYGEDMNYWKTSKMIPGVLLEKAGEFLEKHGATVRATAKASECKQTVYLIDFEFKPDRFRCIWPVLPTKTGDKTAAERQAATMLFHDIKSRGIRLALHGPRTAFVDYLMLPNGRTAAQATNADLEGQTKLLPTYPT